MMQAEMDYLETVVVEALRDDLYIGGIESLLHGEAHEAFLEDPTVKWPVLRWRQLAYELKIEKEVDRQENAER